MTIFESVSISATMNVDHLFAPVNESELTELTGRLQSYMQRIREMRGSGGGGASMSMDSQTFMQVS